MKRMNLEVHLLDTDIVLGGSSKNDREVIFIIINAQINFQIIRIKL